MGDERIIILYYILILVRYFERIRFRLSGARAWRVLGIPVGKYYVNWARTQSVSKTYDHHLDEFRLKEFQLIAWEVIH